MIHRRPICRCACVLFLLLPANSIVVGAQNNAGKKSPSPRVSLAPRFIPGQTFRYEMEFETTTDTTRSGLATDPQGPSSLVVDWNATVRLEILAD